MRTEEAIRERIKSIKIKKEDYTIDSEDSWNGEIDALSWVLYEGDAE